MTINYIVFRNAIQKAIKEGRFKLAKQNTIKMTIDTDPFPCIATNMISTSDCSFHRRVKN